jgi:hypothetical protein
MNSLASATLKISGKESPTSKVLENQNREEVNASRGLKTDPGLSCQQYHQPLTDFQKNRKEWTT